MHRNPGFTGLEVHSFLIFYTPDQNQTEMLNKILAENLAIIPGGIIYLPTNTYYDDIRKLAPIINYNHFDNNLNLFSLEFKIYLFINSYYLKLDEVKSKQLKLN